MADPSDTDQGLDIDAELESMRIIYEAFRPLSIEQRIRVLGAVLCLVAKSSNPAREAIVAWKARQE